MDCDYLAMDYALLMVSLRFYYIMNGGCLVGQLRVRAVATCDIDLQILWVTVDALSVKISLTGLYSCSCFTELPLYSYQGCCCCSNTESFTAVYCYYHSLCSR